MCSIVGFSGIPTPVTQSAMLQFNIGSYKLEQPHKFAVVADSVMPYCMLLGLDFQVKYDISLDEYHGCCWQGDQIVADLRSADVDLLAHAKTSFCLTQCQLSHQISAKSLNDEIRFAIEGSSNTITGLSLLLEDDTINTIQSKDNSLRTLKRQLVQSVPHEQWPKILKPFCKHAAKLSVRNGVLVYT